MITHISLWSTKYGRDGLRENKHTQFRPLYEATIEKYAREMKAGAWTVTSQGIAFADDGTLL